MFPLLPFPTDLSPFVCTAQMLYMFSAFFIEKYGGGGKKDKAAKKAA